MHEGRREMVKRNVRKNIKRRLAERGMFQKDLAEKLRRWRIGCLQLDERSKLDRNRKTV